MKPQDKAPGLILFSLFVGLILFGTGLYAHVRLWFVLAALSVMAGISTALSLWQPVRAGETESRNYYRAWSKVKRLDTVYMDETGLVEIETDEEREVRNMSAGQFNAYICEVWRDYGCWRQAQAREEEYRNSLDFKRTAPNMGDEVEMVVYNPSPTPTAGGVTR